MDVWYPMSLSLSPCQVLFMVLFDHDAFTMAFASSILGFAIHERTVRLLLNTAREDYEMHRDDIPRVLKVFSRHSRHMRHLAGVLADIRSTDAEAYEDAIQEFKRCGPITETLSDGPLALVVNPDLSEEGGRKRIGS